MRIAHMTLSAMHNKPTRERATPPDLDHIAQMLWIGGLTQNAMIKPLALRMRPFEQFHRAVNRRAFFIAGEKKSN